MLFPYRLARTFFFFFNFMSTLFSGKPLANSLDLNRMDNRQAFVQLWGHVLDTKKAMSKSKHDSAQPLAPKDWELIRCPPGQAAETLASQVLSFDISDAGDLVYSDGTRIYLRTHRTNHGEARELTRGALVQNIVVLD